MMKGADLLLSSVERRRIAEIENKVRFGDMVAVGCSDLRWSRGLVRG